VGLDKKGEGLLTEREVRIHTEEEEPASLVLHSMNGVYTRKLTKGPKEGDR